MNRCALSNVLRAVVVVVGGTRVSRRRGRPERPIRAGRRWEKSGNCHEFEEFLPDVAVQW